MLGAEVGGGGTGEPVPTQKPRLFNGDSLGFYQRPEIIDRHMMDIGRFIPGYRQKPRHWHLPFPE